MTTKKYERIEIKVSKEKKEQIQEVCKSEYITQTGLLIKAFDLYYKNYFKK